MNERIWEGVRFREIVDDDISIDGYWVGENGDVWSCWKCGRNGYITDTFRKKMKPQISKSKQYGTRKYEYICFRQKAHRGVARLVLSAFGDVSAFNNGWIAIHKNGDKSDNRIDNLTAIDTLEYFASLPGNKFGGFKTKLLDPMGLEIIKMLMDGVSQRQICITMNCNHKVVMRIRKMIDDAMGVNA